MFNLAFKIAIPMYACETADHLFSRLSHTEIDLSKLPLFSKEPEIMKKVRSIEIIGSDFTGKRDLLHEILILTLLPNKFEDYAIYGHNVAVILFDCALNFPILSFAKLLETRITAILTSNSNYITDYIEVSPIHVSRLKEYCLSRLFLYKITSVLDLHTNILASIDFISGTPDIGLVVIDGISNGLWMDVTLTQKSYTDTHLANRFIALLQKIEFVTNLPIIVSGIVETYGDTRKTGDIQPQTYKSLHPKCKGWEQYFQCKVMLEKQSANQTAHIRISVNNQLIKVDAQYVLSEHGIEIIS